MTNEILETSVFFGSPVYYTHKPEFLEPLTVATDLIIQDAIERDKSSTLIERKKKFGSKIKDHGHVYSSNSLIGLSEFKEFTEYVGNTAHNILDNQGYDMKLYDLFMTELWAQEFPKSGGGQHDTHVHWDNHISGFYFLKCSDKTSFPIFHDPRPAAYMTKLTLKKEEDLNFGQHKVYYKPNPGDFIFFNSYLPHQFVLDHGIEPFRFIHFNLQAIRSFITQRS